MAKGHSFGQKRLKLQLLKINSLRHRFLGAFFSACRGARAAGQGSNPYEN
jgi:hypothetical protein